MAVAARSGEACEGAGAQSLEVRAGSGQVFSGGDDSLFVRAIVAVHRSRRGGKYIILRGEPQYNSLPLSPNHLNTQSRLHATLSTHTTQRDGTRVRSQRPHSVTARDGSPFMSLPATGAGSGTPSRDRLPVPLTPLAPGALLLGGRDASAAGATSTLLRISARSFSSAAPMMHCSAACLIDI